jgi:hypothetical protein
MANIVFRATSDLLDAAKQAALDAVAGYGQLTPYTLRDAWDIDSTEVDRQRSAA